MLKDKVAVIYGAGGAIGGAVARAFAREGARVFLTGRRRASVDAVVQAITSAGGLAEAAQVDALDAGAIDAHLQQVIDKAARIDVSFNAIGIPNAEIVGVPLIELRPEKFMEPVLAYTRSYFLTAQLAARRMVPKKSGVILTVSALNSRTAAPMVGGYSSAMAGKEALTRALSLELGTHGIRVACLRPHALPESESIHEVYKLKAAKVMSYEQWQEVVAGRTHTNRLSTLTEVGNAAAFLASDRASGMTGMTLNLSMGGVDE